MGHKLGEKLLAKAKAQPRREEVTDLVPEWAEDLAGAPIFMQAMSGVERDAWEAERWPAHFDDDGKLVHEANDRNLRARGVSRGLRDEAGERLFPDAEGLGQSVDGEILQRLYAVFLRVNGLSAKKDDSLKNAPGGAGSGTPPASSDAPPANSSSPATAAS